MDLFKTSFSILAYFIFRVFLFTFYVYAYTALPKICMGEDETSLDKRLYEFKFQVVVCISLIHEFVLSFLAYSKATSMGEGKLNSAEKKMYLILSVFFAFSFF